MRKHLTGVAALVGGESYTLADLKNERIDRVGALDAIVSAAEIGRRGLTVDEQKTFNTGMDALSKLDAEIEIKERQDQLAKAAVVARRQSHNPFGALNPMTAAAQPNHKLPPLKAFKGPDAARDAYLAGNWWKALNCRLRGAPDEGAEAIINGAGLNIQASMTEGSGGSGGYLVPTPLSNAIIEYRQQVGVMRRVAQIEPMTSEVKDVPKLLTGPTVTYPGEAGEFTASDESWGQVGLTAKKRGILTKVSRELRDDAIIPIVDHLAERMAHEFALQEDNEGINGDSTSTYGGETGLLASLGAGGVSQAAAGHDTWPELDMTDFTAAMAKLPSKHSNGASWICSMNFYVSAMLRALAAAGGNSMQSLAQGVDMGLFLGKPVYFTDWMPTTTAAATVCALYGNFSEAMILGDRMGIEIAVSDQRYFEYDLIGVRSVTRYDLAVHDAGTASAAGAYIGFKTAA